MSVDKVREWAERVRFNGGWPHTERRIPITKLGMRTRRKCCLAYSAYLRGLIEVCSAWGPNHCYFLRDAIEAWHSVMRGERMATDADGATA